MAQTLAELPTYARIKMIGRYLAHKFFITPKVPEIFLEKKRNKKKGRSQKTLTYMRE